MHFPHPLPPPCSAQRNEAVLSLIGSTPLVALRMEPEGMTIHAKCEFLNPSGSIKDRLAQCIILDAEKRGLLQPDSIILECTSGNTGISLAMLGAALGHRVAILMSDSVSGERRQLIQQLGAELILFQSGASYQTGIDLSLEMAANDRRYFLPCQFENPLNAEDHIHTTGQEILRQVPRAVDAFVAGFGTGGSLAGWGKAIKARCPDARVYAMEPDEAAMLSGEMPCCHWIEGVSGGFIPALLRTAPLDGTVKVKSTEAMAMTQRLKRQFGLLVGTSSGANVAAAVKIAQDLPPGACVVTLLCDRAERYFSTRLFADFTSPKQPITVRITHDDIVNVPKSTPYHSAVDRASSPGCPNHAPLNLVASPAPMSASSKWISRASSDPALSSSSATVSRSCLTTNPPFRSPPSSSPLSANISPRKEDTRAEPHQLRPQGLPCARVPATCANPSTASTASPPTNSRSPPPVTPCSSSPTSAATASSSSTLTEPAHGSRQNASKPAASAGPPPASPANGGSSSTPKPCNFSSTASTSAEPPSSPGMNVRIDTQKSQKLVKVRHVDCYYICSGKRHPTRHPTAPQPPRRA